MKKILILLFGALVLFNSCKKEQLTHCEDFPPPPTGPGYQYVLDGIQYQTIAFNPNNYNEFCGTRLTSNGNELYTYNLSTNELKVIAKDFFFGYPVWGRNNWILLNGKDWNIYKIKPNGDSLTQITFTNNCIRPTWNYNGSKIIYWDNSINKVIQLSLFSGSLTQQNNTIPNEYGDWLSDSNSVVGKNWNYIYMYTHLSEQTTLKEYKLNTHNFVSIQVYESNNYIISTLDGVYKFNFDQNTYQSLMPCCDASCYKSTAYNKLQNRLYFIKQKKKLIDKNNISVRTRIVHTDMDGNNEIELNLP